ncbi:MAG: PqqD family protein [Bacteroidales bacterium]|nr:PqqD family protein [Bacteroidales bacterium]NTV19338.1 PqqD family protein [Bacteroidales bacterium]
MKLIPDLTLREIAGEKMLVLKGAAGVDLTKVVMLNSTAEYLWNSLPEKEFQNEDVEELLIQKYGIAKDQAKIDAGAWIQSMVSACLIVS